MKNAQTRIFIDNFIANGNNNHKGNNSNNDEIDIDPSSSQLIGLNTYNIILKTYSLHGDTALAIDLLKEIGDPALNLSQETNTNNSMGNNTMIHIQVIKGSLLCHSHKEPIEVFNKMMHIDGQHLNVKSYTIIMDYYRQTNNIHGAIAILHQMEQRSFYPIIYMKIVFKQQHVIMHNRVYSKKKKKKKKKKKCVFII